MTSYVYSIAGILAFLICFSTIRIVLNWIVRPIGNMAAAMTAIAEQKYETVIPNLGDQNELGALASALDIFKNNGLERRRLVEQQQEAARQQVARAKKLEEEVKNFETTVANVVNAVASASTEMQSTSETLSDV